MLKSTPNVRKSPRSGLNVEGRLSDPQIFVHGSGDLHGIVVQGPACLAVKPLDLHMVNVASIPTGPTHGEA